MAIPRGLNVNIESIVHLGPLHNTTVVKSYKHIDKAVCICTYVTWSLFTRLTHLDC